MDIELEEIRSDINHLDQIAGEVRDYISDADAMEECYDIIDALDELQGKITELQERQKWI
jgi:hypothetical protein